MMKVKIGFIFLMAFLVRIELATAQTSTSNPKVESKLMLYFQRYKYKSQDSHKTRLTGCEINDSAHTITAVVDEYFSTQEFTPTVVNHIYTKLKGVLPKPYNRYKIKVVTNGMAIEDLIPNRLTKYADRGRMWGDIDYEGDPWVRNVSRPFRITHGLNGRHISLWASHGRYFDLKRGKWSWQRPQLFCTTEDLFTQMIVVPYLIPMLENAGAVVFTPRERDPQKNECIIDNDDIQKYPYYQEINNNGRWQFTGQKGFARHSGDYQDNENPFEAGTAKMIATTSKTKSLSQISYQPSFPAKGRYAVYVSYQTLDNSVSDAQYIVCHQGQRTYFQVNQQMGGGTWVYLGTFDFDKGCNLYNRVVLTNHSSQKGVVTADAVRFGGGMGNIIRGENTSGLPRSLEGARYYAQWAGAPYSVYSSKNGEDDYGDDINARSNMTNWLGGGSVYMPSIEGKKVPFELSLAIHSDAGYAEDGKSLVGSLAICTTDFNDGTLNAGISRMASRDFADALLAGVNKDIRYQYGKWARRELFDRNYSETRIPEIPSAILETMSHQNFPDMKWGQDPNFRFTLARSIYKTIVKYINSQHGHNYVIQPLAPSQFSLEFVDGNKVRLSWAATNDPQEATSRPNSYNVYTAIGKGGFDNGKNMKGLGYTVALEPGVVYNFRITAVNRGGESFPTETLSAVYQPGAKKTILVVNGFHRISAPAVIDNDSLQGFDMDTDPGVPDGWTTGWNGRQICFDKSKMGKEGPGGLGYCDNELAGKFIVGNTFDFVNTHVRAMASAKKYNIVSCTKACVEIGKVNLQKYACVDLILGLEKYDPNALKYYKTFSPVLRQKLLAYTQAHGRLIVSGSYLGADMTEKDEQQFLSKVLKLRYAGNDHSNSDPHVTGMGITFDFYKSLNDVHYAATSPDIIQPVAPAYCAMQYSDGTDACVAYGGADYRCFTMGFPFECITLEKDRNNIMRGILNYVMK